MHPLVLSTPITKPSAPFHWDWARTNGQAGKAGELLRWLIDQDAHDLRILDEGAFVRQVSTLGGGFALTVDDGDGTTGWVFSDDSALLVLDDEGVSYASCHPIALNHTINVRDQRNALAQAARKHPSHRPSFATTADRLTATDHVAYWSRLQAASSDHNHTIRDVLEPMLHSLCIGMVVPVVQALTSQRVMHLALHSAHAQSDGTFAPPKVVINPTPRAAPFKVDLTWWGEEVGRKLFAGAIPSVPCLSLLGQDHPTVGFQQHASPRLLAAAFTPPSAQPTQHERLQAHAWCQRLGVPALG